MIEENAPATAAIMQMATGLWLARALWAAARLRIADAIGEESEPIEAIADRTGTHADSLRRLLMALSASGVFRVGQDGRIGHTPISRLLRSDHPSSQRAFVESVLGHEHYQAWAMIDDAVRTGRTAFDSCFGMPVFDYFREHAEAARLFGEAMTGTTRMVEDAVLAAHDFGHFDIGVDIGGSEGSLLRRILVRTPDARGIVFDLPRVTDAARLAWQETAEAPRLSAVGGDFFKSVPAGDLYLLKFILHDWDDELATLILRNIRSAIRADGRVAIVEMVLPDGVAPHPGWLMDINMLVMTGGRERSAAQYETLLHGAGFRTEQVIPTASPMSIIIARPD